MTDLSERLSAPATPPGTTSRDVRRATAARRRAERKEFRRFTTSTRRRRINRVVGLSALVGLVVTVAILTTSPVFSLNTIEVEGVELLSDVEVRASLEPLMGTPLARVGSADVVEILSAFPLVRSVETRVDLPNTLVVTIGERTPLGAIQTPSGFDIVDQAAVVLWSESVRPASLPVILVSPDGDATPFRAVVRALEVLPPQVLAGVDAVTATSHDTVRFSLHDSDHIVFWGSAEFSEAKARALPAALVAAGGEGSRLIDLSTPDTVVIRDVG